MSSLPETQETNLVLERPSDGVALLRINRPQVRNALNMAVRQELSDAFRQLSFDNGVRAIVITGNEKAFCAGADLNEFLNATTIEILQRNMHLVWEPIAGCPKPVIAAVNGFALGGGCELAMHADIIIAGESARFGQPEVRIGIMPGAGGTQRLTRAVGKFAAMRMVLTGQMVPARDALAMGLVSTVVADENVLPEALGVAREIAALPPLAVRQIKELVLESMNGSLESGLRLERKAFQILFSSADKTEGIRAFMEKRKPVFRGC